MPKQIRLSKFARMEAWAKLPKCGKLPHVGPWLLAPPVSLTGVGHWREVLYSNCRANMTRHGFAAMSFCARMGGTDGADVSSRAADGESCCNIARLCEDRSSSLLVVRSRRKHHFLIPAAETAVYSISGSGSPFGTVER